jgi:hypothetical protein
MAVDPGISMAAAKAALDAIVDRLDTGTGANARVRIYDGTQPADPDAAPTGTLLAEIDLGAAAVFGAAATGTGGSANSATATATVLPKTQTNATAAGTATWFRAVNKDTTGVAIIDGSVGTATSDMIIDNASIAIGQTVKLNSWKVKLPNNP